MKDTIEKEKCIGIVLAGGSGRRMNSTVPKQYMGICGKPLLWYCLNAFETSDIIDEIILVVGESEIDTVREKVVEQYGFHKVSGIVSGGKERYDSVANGLHYIEDRGLFFDAQKYVFIQDGARPFVDEEMLQRLYQDVKKYSACVAAVPSKDTIKISDAEGFVADTPDRSHVWNVQTPQVFEYELIRDAYFSFERDMRADSTQKPPITDDASLCELYTNRKVKLTMGGYQNIKITTPDDIPVAEEILRRTL